MEKSIPRGERKIGRGKARIRINGTSSGKVSSIEEQ